MTRSDLLKEIIRTYHNFGWTLRFVLLNENAQSELSEIRSLIPANAPIEPAAINALWFSRQSGKREAWELRSFSQTPFALIETFDQNTPDFEQRKIRQAMVEKLSMNQQKFKV